MRPRRPIAALKRLGFPGAREGIAALASVTLVAP